ncbi:hypothetical protein [Streptomyces sp. NPDC031705]
MVECLAIPAVRPARDTELPRRSKDALAAAGYFVLSVLPDEA